jgi:hypothetical protein
VLHDTKHDNVFTVNAPLLRLLHSFILWILLMTFNIRTLGQIAVAATVAVCATAGSAKAEDYKGWDYAKSSIKNGVNYAEIGGSTNPFEFYSLAMKDMGDRMVVAINANLNENGGDDKIAYGDLLFDFTTKGLKGASESSSLFGVKFNTAKSVATQNSGFSNFDQRAGYLPRYSTESMTELNNLGDLQTTDAYFDGMRTGDNVILNSIQTGTKEGDLSMLTGVQLSGMGLDFGHFGETGSRTFGFSFLKPKGFDGNFISTLFAECANDGIALKGISTKLVVAPPVKSVPEPFAIAGLAVVGGALVRKRRAAAKA